MPALPAQTGGRQGSATICIVIAALLTAAVVSYFAFIRKPAVEDGLMPEPPIGDSGDTTEPLLVGNNAIFVSDAKPATRVKIGFAILAGGGYVVIHEESGGKPGAIVGNSNTLPQGERRDFEATLSRESVDGETLYAMLHSDNGDGAFNAADDPPIRDDQGNIVLMKFQVSSSAEESGAISL